MEDGVSALQRDRLPPEIDRAGIVPLAPANLCVQPQHRGGLRATVVFDRPRLEPLGFLQTLLPLGRPASTDQGIGKRTEGQPVGRVDGDGAFERLACARDALASSQMQSSELGERFDIVGVQQQRDDELGVPVRLAAVLDVGAPQRPVRSGIVRRGRHGALQQPDRSVVIEVQLRQPGEGTIQLALSDQQDEPIGHGEQIHICVIGALEFFRQRRQSPAQRPGARRRLPERLGGVPR